MSTAAATVAIKKPKSKSNLFHGSSDHECMCSWKKPKTWPATADLDTKLPWCEYIWQKVAQHADSNDVWFGVPYRFVAKDINQSSEKTVALRMSIQKYLDLKTKAIIHTSSSRDIISLERCWNATQFGKLRLALHISVGNRQNLLLKEIVLATGGLKKIATRFPNFWKRRGDLLQNLLMGISSCRRQWLQKLKSRIL